MPRGRRKEPDPNSLMFRLLAPDLKDQLRDLSLKGYVYIGRTGFGFTTSLQRAMLREGTEKILGAQRAYMSELQQKIVDFCVTEGGRWASYALLVYYLREGEREGPK